ncbi:DUF637 domain-containing protein [Ancylomarina sp. DW003]|nr:DUF637 domain-containing protein [Ancylomarina sp. DW003]
MGNNPMMMIDPDGENPLVAAVIVAAIIAGGTYTASVAFSDGGFSNWNWGQFAGSVITGAASGALTGGVGDVFGGLGGSALNSFGAKALNEAGRAFAHGVVQGTLGTAQGGSFKNGFASGALGSLGGSAFGAVGGKFAESRVGMTSFGALSGGVGAELSGGDFWRGAGTGAIIGLLNHYAHQIEGDLAEKRAFKQKHSLDGMNLADANGGLSNSYYKGLATTGSIYSAKGLYRLVNAEFIDQVKYNNSIRISGSPSSVASLKVPGFIKFIGKWLGPAIGLHGVYDTNAQYKAKNLTYNEMVRDQVSNGISFIPVFGTGWSLGWELGMKYGPSTWYGKNDYKWFK